MRSFDLADSIFYVSSKQESEGEPLLGKVSNGDAGPASPLLAQTLAMVVGVGSGVQTTVNPS